MPKTRPMRWFQGGAVVLTMAALLVAVIAFGRVQLGATPAPPAGHMHHQGAAAEPEGFFHNLFKVYTPRQVCMYQEAPVIWLHLVSDLFIGIAYYSIPVALVYFVRRRKDLAFNWIFWMFAAFILACGTTHFVGVWDLWQPLYKIDGIIKLLTAIVSIWTAIALWPLIPKALALPSPRQLEQRVQTRTVELAEANQALRHEIDARKQVEREREELLERERAARAEAERANRMKDEFVATLSHELRTPLHAILGWASVLNRKYGGEPDLGDGLSIIERNTRAQARLIEDLLDISRIVSGKLRLDLRSVDLADVVRGAIEAVAPAADAKQVRIEKVLDPLAGPVTGDPNRLQQVVWNLLSNAMKFTPKGGRIQILLERVNSHLELTVADDGVGIAPEFLPHLFERFRQADASASRRYGGLGLGLAIVRHIVELHGGSVRAKSPGEGQGAAFIVTLPLRIAKIEEPPEQRVHPTDGGGPLQVDDVTLPGMRILVMDDEPDARLLIRKVLEESGATVLLAGSATEAIELLRQERPHLLLCDIGMPDEDGYEFITRVRHLPADEGRDTPAVALTAFARVEDRTKAMLTGFQNHLAKPFEPEELIATVYSFAGRRAQPA